MAWPERIVLILLVAIIMIAAEIGALVAAKEFHASGGLVAIGFVAVVFLDIWAVFRTIDHLFAGPARRHKDRILKFSP